MNITKPVQFIASYGTNVGLKRTLNEDALLAKFPVFVVADGMGGHQAGEVASATAVSSLASLVDKSNLVARDVVEAVRAAQTQVSGLSDGSDGGAGTTLTGVVAVRSVSGELSWLIINIGDSRTYRLVGQNFQRLTTDHSHVQELIDANQITEEAALTHPSRNVITKALGDRSSEGDFWMSPIVRGERIVVVSDGATEGVLDRELLEVVGAPEPDVAVASVIDQALGKGGTDNITVIVVDVVDSDTEGTERFAPRKFVPAPVVKIDPESVTDGDTVGRVLEPANDATNPSKRR